MPKKAPVKMWDKSRKIEVITSSPLEKNDASVKAYWRNYVRELELSYKDDKFWESQAGIVRSLVPASTFNKLAKIYSLPLTDKPYYPGSVPCSPIPSFNFYKDRTNTRGSRSKYSMSDFCSEEEKSQTALSTHSESTSGSPTPLSIDKSSRIRVDSSAKSVRSIRTLKSLQRLLQKELSEERQSTVAEDDMIVHCGDDLAKRSSNPHHSLLSKKSETDMISWDSRYKQKALIVSASDEFSRRAEIASKQIAMEFFEWFTSLGEVEFKSELKRAEDIEQLFQVWFDEHASRGLEVVPKVLPCVLQTIASATGVPEASCPNTLKRQVEFDIWAETTPEHTTAFGTALPLKMKHVPPDNNTAAQWRSVRAPEDLASMACVWDDIKHLSSTKEFQRWLQQRPHLAMPRCLRSLGKSDSKALYVVPSDYVISASSDSDEQLDLPVSKLNIELKSVLSKLMD